ncbi:Amidophosphoribosyltransferase [Xylariales sp. PMI_506]|nr:Amidophosphoribosyltransferase [Xylariales sp. PMI_506]
MCGIVGVSLSSSDICATSDLLEAAVLLQHRGQDACGIVCGSPDGTLTMHKGIGLATEVFGPTSHISCSVRSTFGIGHVRYGTNGKYNEMQTQPIVATNRGNIALCHNGHIENSRQLHDHLIRAGIAETDALGDSELMLELILSKQPPRCLTTSLESIPDWIVSGLQELYARCIGSFACILFIPTWGLVAFRDPHGIKPLILAERGVSHGQSDYIFASESVAVRSLGYSILRDVRPGNVYAGSPRCISQQIAPELSYTPDIFEYVYFARAESIMDGISVNRSRQYMGEALARTIIQEMTTRDGFNHDDIDCVIPVPETSYTCALSVAQYLQKPLSFGLVKNRFIFRTFILPTQKQRIKAVNRKLSTVQEEFEGRNVLIVDDSIVRGTTASQIIKMAREAGAKKVFFASGSPAIRSKHIYGIDLADESKLIAYGRSNTQIRKALGCDGIFYLPLEELINCCLRARFYGDVSSFEVGVFNGSYITKLLGR